MENIKESLYESKINCLLCKKEFKTKKSKSKIFQLKEVDRELRQVHRLPRASVEPFYYAVHVCAHCGFSFTEQFSPYFSPGTKEALAALLQHWKPRSYNHEHSSNEALNIYKMTLYMASIKKETAYLQATLALKICWIYDDMERQEEARKYRQTAYDYFTESYQNGDYEKNGQSIHFVSYMLATLAYKLGDLPKATYFFSHVFKHQAMIRNRKIIDLTREQWDEIRGMKEAMRQQNEKTQYV